MFSYLRVMLKEMKAIHNYPVQAQSIYNKEYPLKSSYNSIIPLNIFQTWGTKDLPPKMKENVEELKKKNPEFTHYLYDNEECREFIKKHFESDVLMSYDTLIPGAFKADLWRLCVLYIHGGIYLDIKAQCINNFKLIVLTEAEHYVQDRISRVALYNGLLVCKKKNEFLMEAIKRIVRNVQTTYYGESLLSPTGPRMLGDLAMEKQTNLPIDLFFTLSGTNLVYNHIFVIRTEYPGYREEQAEFYKSKNTHHYSHLWGIKKIYRQVQNETREESKLNLIQVS